MKCHLLLFLEWFGKVSKVPIKRCAFLGLNDFASWESCLLTLVPALVDILQAAKLAKAIPKSSCHHEPSPLIILFCRQQCDLVSTCFLCQS